MVWSSWFTSGMAFPVDLMPKVMIVIGKCTPGWWFCRSISAAMNSEGTVSVSNWFPGIALVLLFGVAFIALGLALSQMRRLRPNLAAPGLDPIGRGLAKQARAYLRGRGASSRCLRATRVARSSAPLPLRYALA